MTRKRHTQKAASFLEYVAFFIVILSTFMVFQVYIRRAMQGQLRKSGEMFAYGKQYDPSRTVECVYDSTRNIWYTTACYDNLVVKSKCYRGIYNTESCIQAAMSACNFGCSLNGVE
ncbi:MAG: hypothetical protein HQL19_08305 [Candidatus Omnitrophica bacterium]|nr:hypothetical protein [Candidatus Omnitrophota bacterium]